ncbi:uncharacterized protein B0T15DRAFT_214554 [Chaetomium strumarium]|uniref:DUF6594 domain-containing protein n=1 Tax=Chaetomium strumarium TaxID=1170767 RepID=A0AAJ0GTK4_9PEZI|nr:hypothetical protein B0T15DRAFT_214554 [Chaetomium strumarium]
MICHHCPGRKFESEAELGEHVAEHVRIQQALRRRSGRTYGSRLAQETPEVPSQGPILPVAASSGTTGVASVIPLSSLSTTGGTTASQNADDTHGRLAGFMNKDDAYLIFRRFSALNIRNILRIQTELADLENRLEAETEGGVVSGSLESVMESRLSAYNEAVTRYIQLSKLGRPEPIPLSDLRRWASRNLSSGKVELSFLEEKGHSEDDLMCLSGGVSDKNWLYRLTEQASWRLLSMPAFGGRTVPVSRTGALHLYSDDSVRLLLRAFLTATSSILLLVPIGILSTVEDKSTVVIVVALCCIAVAVVMAVATESRDHEIIMAVSA